LALGVAKVEQGPAAVAITLDPRGLLQAETLLGLVNLRGSRFRLSPEMVLTRALDRGESDRPLDAARDVLEQLLRLAQAPEATLLEIEAESVVEQPAAGPANRALPGPGGLVGPKGRGRLRRVR
jgi:hypothetical protein